jgi:leader peptidase (prepilin peptidase)/N-methyltransferase
MSSDDFPLLAVAIPCAGVIGIFVGSFLNVVIYRTPLGLSVSTPRSFCPTCQHQLTWWENIPVISWTLLKGRCRTCRQPISIRYPLVELTTGIVFALVTWGWHGTVLSAAYCCLAATMIAVGLIEYGGRRSPLSVSAIGTATGQLVIIVAAGWQHHWQVVGGSLTGTAAGVVVFAILRSTDPECTDPRAHGRSALLVAGCWVGGLGIGPAAIGGAVWIVTYFLCMVATWSMSRQRFGTGSTQSFQQPTHPALGTPLVTALAVAMAASLIAGG